MRNPEPATPEALQSVFKVADLHPEDYSVSLQLRDGRHFNAKLADGVDVKRRDKVNIKHEGLGPDGVPLKPVVTKVVDEPAPRVDPAAPPAVEVVKAPSK